ncbi:MAG TPA: hypothetical protein DCE41_18185 [Cytophagales bacterium]|nr:hypothetical protein [Cytophagales bacterium]HAA21746.1 hypothetical protein [Cytophagales bacterium]HAP63593.1 hypothetical protein [Cytophagales bacterium]
MNKTRLFLVLAILGTVVPYWHLISFLSMHGINLSLFWQQMMGTPIAAFFSWDVILSSVALILWILPESKRLGIKHPWLFILFNFTVGVSLALPAFLYARERKRSLAH